MKHRPAPRILFICKKNSCYGFVNYSRRSAGLYNSTRFIVEALREKNIEAHIVEVHDNNCIDREVAHFKPTIVVIEALWVVPEKFDILRRLHPHVSWAVHLHSEIPFLAMEGIAMEWLIGYAKRNIRVIANSPDAYSALLTFLPRDHLSYLPNVYRNKPRHSQHTLHGHIDIGCFGAVRPFKNQLLQAMAALQFSESLGKDLRFHINSSRVETGGEPVLKNLIELFKAFPRAKLIQNPWKDPEDFLDLLQNHIHLGMQVSFTETFNVVTADYITAGIPIVVSKEIDWVSRWNMAQDHSIKSIVKTMHKVWGKNCLVKWNQHLLAKTSQLAEDLWYYFVWSLH